MITYQFDASKPYLVLDTKGERVTVAGQSKVIQTSKGEFGGVHGAWKIPKWELLSKEQKKSIQWLRRKAGHRQADRERERLCSVAIASYSHNNNSLHG
jgi:hypothetical protein